MITLVAFATTILHGEFLHRERLASIDQQVRDVATALLGSELNGLRQVDFDRVESILSDELGENGIGKFFVLRNDSNQVLFESASAMLVPFSEIPRAPQWVTLNQKGQYIRVLNLQLPNVPDRTLQVGLVLDENLVSRGYLSRATWFYTAIIMLLGLGVAWILASILMRPITQLAQFMSCAEHGPGAVLPPLSNDLKRFSRGPRDEFSRLLSVFETLIERVNREYKMSRFWSYQMAHELKTPMALIEAQVVEAQRSAAIETPVARAVLGEVFGVSETITSFLTWAEVENAGENKGLYVTNAEKLVRDLRVRLQAGERVEIRLVRDFRVMTNLQHFEQVIGNLTSNALKYSNATVVIEIAEHVIRVRDQGPGLPGRVLDRLGEPFNRGGAGKGNGLGLALVKSISRRYGWTVTFSSGAGGTTAMVRFPDLTEPALSH